MADHRRKRRRGETPTTSDSSLNSIKKKMDSDYSSSSQKSDYDNMQFKLYNYSNDADADLPKAVQFMKTGEVFDVNYVYQVYDPLQCPATLKENKLWNQMKSVIEEMFQYVKQPLPASFQWSICMEDNNHVTDSSPDAAGDSQETQTEEDMTDRWKLKYPELRYTHIAMLQALCEAFILKPSLGNTQGRQALFNIFYCLHEIVSGPHQHRIHIFNVGGSAPTWLGNCTVGFMPDKGSVDANWPDEKLEKHVADQGVPRKNIHRRVPDFQLVSYVDLTSPEIEDKTVYITGEVKSAREYSRTTGKPFLQAWEEGLIGLLKKDKTYVALLTPNEVTLIHICIEGPQAGQKLRRLVTYKKEYKLLCNDLKFNTQKLEEFMTDVLAILYNIVDKN